MKNINRVLIIAMFLIICISTNILATAETEKIKEEPKIPISVKAKIIEIKEVEEEKIGSATTQVQKVKVKIIEGEYKDRTFDSKYTLSLSMDSKIMAFELKKGDTVFVQITEKGEIVDNVVVQYVVRQHYVIYMLLLFFIIVFAIRRNKRTKSNICIGSNCYYNIFCNNCSYI